jgi:predicted RNase H-like nuclease (RuvC/YqgF family)
MFRKQLTINIEDLDRQIGTLSNELEELKKDSKYEATMDKLKMLTELRTSLAKGLKENEKSDALSEMDRQIEELTLVVNHLGRDDVYSEKLAKLEALTKVRCQLGESKVKNSVKPVIVSGLLGMTSMLIVLKYEKDNVIITSKAFSMVSSMFKRS